MFISTARNQVALLIDPEKVYQSIDKLANWCSEIEQANVDYIFVGGSTVSEVEMNMVCKTLKENTRLPVILFPGASHHVNAHVDAVLLLNLISGRNPVFLIGHHIAAAENLWKLNCPIVSTSYLLIDGGIKTTVQTISDTEPISQYEQAKLSAVVKAGRLIGRQVCSLVRGIEAKNNVSVTFIQEATEIFPYVISGGGVRTIDQLRTLHEAGANLVVIGNHLESKPSFLQEIKAYKQSLI